MEKYTLNITGFRSKEQVKAFIDWYEGQGEQDAEIWFECRMDEGEIDVSRMPVDVTVPYTWEGNTLTATLKIRETAKTD